MSPNDDTLYSQAWLDLRAEPIILSVPEVPQVPRRRYYSVQFVDGYSHNVEIFGVRTTGSEPGKYLIAANSWKGEVPPSINETVYIEGDYVYVLVRIIIYGEQDLPNVTAIQNQLMLTPLSEFLSNPSSPPVERFYLTRVLQRNFVTFDFFRGVNEMLQYIRVHSTEVWLFKQFARIGIEAGQTFPPPDMSTCEQEAVLNGIENANEMIVNYRDPEAETARGWRVSIHPPIFGNRSVMQSRYIDRAVASRNGIYGLDPEEAYYPSTEVDTEGDTLDASVHNYTLTICPNQVPKVNGFWSITMYNEDLRFVENVINRYSIGDRTHNLHLHNNTLTIIIQKDMPMVVAEVNNWLPAPNGKFVLIARLYWPTKETFNLPYLPPGVEKSQNIY